MFEIIKTHVFDTWLTNLRDIRAQARIQARIDRIALGNLGDVKPVGGGVSEARIFYGPGYRLSRNTQGRPKCFLPLEGSKTERSGVFGGVLYIHSGRNDGDRIVVWWR